MPHVGPDRLARCEPVAGLRERSGADREPEAIHGSPGGGLSDRPRERSVLHQRRFAPRHRRQSLQALHPARLCGPPEDAARCRHRSGAAAVRLQAPACDPRAEHGGSEARRPERGRGEHHAARPGRLRLGPVGPVDHVAGIPTDYLSAVRRCRLDPGAPCDRDHGRRSDAQARHQQLAPGSTHPARVCARTAPIMFGLRWSAASRDMSALSCWALPNKRRRWTDSRSRYPMRCSRW